MRARASFRTRKTAPVTDNRPLSHAQWMSTDASDMAPIRQRSADRSFSSTRSGGKDAQFFYDFSGLPLSADLPGSDEIQDPIHQPIIDQYRREQGLPPGGGNEEGQRVGPSDAEIKYGGLGLRDLSVLYVNFHHASPPGAPDHSQHHPGPGGATAHRAGYTRVRVQKRLTISWDTGPAQSDGRIPLFAQSVNVFYRLDPIEMMVSSSYAVGSCPYRVTLEHERSHVRDFLRLFHEAREALIARLAVVSVPTRQAPQIVAPADVAATQDAIGEQLRQVILVHSADLVAQMEADRNAKDAPAQYAAVYARCPASEW